jgi:hypothetical protein
MKFTIHVTYFYLESRIKYINNIINETNNYEHPADIYIHTNNFDLTDSSLNQFTNGTINLIMI